METKPNEPIKLPNEPIKPPRISTTPGKRTIGERPIVQGMFRPKVLKLLLEIRSHEEVYISILARNINLTYSHAIKIIKEFVVAES